MSHPYQKIGDHSYHRQSEKKVLSFEEKLLDGMEIVKDKDGFARCIAYGDYIYSYITSYSHEDPYYENMDSYMTNVSATVDGWNVRVKNKKEMKYGKIEKELLGIPVKSISCCFKDCKNLNCEMDLSYLTDVILAAEAFKNCYELKYASILPDSILYMEHCFESCLSFLPNVEIKIPSKVKNIDYCFAYYAKTDTDGIPEAKKYLGYVGSRYLYPNDTDEYLAFVPEHTLPDSVLSMNGLYYCSHLSLSEDFPKKPKNVKYDLFSGYYTHDGLYGGIFSCEYNLMIPEDAEVYSALSFIEGRIPFAICIEKHYKTKIHKDLHCSIDYTHTTITFAFIKAHKGKDGKYTNLLTYKFKNHKTALKKVYGLVERVKEDYRKKYNTDVFANGLIPKEIKTFSYDFYLIHTPTVFPDAFDFTNENYNSKPILN